MLSFPLYADVVIYKNLIFFVLLKFNLFYNLTRSHLLLDFEFCGMTFILTAMINIMTKCNPCNYSHFLITRHAS